MERFVETLIRLESECIKSIAIVEAAKKDLHTLRSYLSMTEFINDGIVVDERNDGCIQINEFISDGIVTNEDNDERLPTNVTTLNVKLTIPAFATPKQDKGDLQPGVGSASSAFGEREGETIAPFLFPQLLMKFSTKLTDLEDLNKDVGADPNGAGLQDYIRFNATSKFIEDDISSIQTLVPTCEDEFLEYPKDSYCYEDVVYNISEGVVVFLKVQRGGVAKYVAERPEPKPPDSFSSQYKHVTEVEKTVCQQQEVGWSVNTIALGAYIILNSATEYIEVGIAKYGTKKPAPNLPGSCSTQSQHVSRLRLLLNYFMRSGGAAVVTRIKEAMWIDRCYFLQAEKYLSASCILMRAAEEL